MRPEKFFTCPCEHCGGHIEFPADGIGTTIECPHCANETELTLPPLEGESSAAPRVRIWTIGGLIVLLALLGAAFYALHRAKQIGARAKRAPANPIAAPAKSGANPPEQNPSASIPPSWIVTNEFAVSPVGLTRRPGNSLLSVTGTVRNVSSRRRIAVGIELDLLNAAGASIGQASDRRALMEPRAEWPFEAPVVDAQPAAARLHSVRDGGNR